MTSAAIDNETVDRPQGPRLPSKMLVEAGFSAMSRIALVLCRLRFLDFARARKFILPRRAISLLSLAASAGKATFLELTVNTASETYERGAARVTVRYFGFLGREVGTHKFSFFADTLGVSDPQRVYVNTPAGAFWTLVTIQRNTDKRRIGFTGSLRLSAVSDEPLLTLETALLSRDRRALEHHLAQALDNKDRSAATRLLSRLIFLERRASDIKALRFIADIDQVMTDFTKRANSCAAAPYSYRYSSLFSGAFDNSVPLSKWLASEAISLNRAAGNEGDDTGVIAVPAGPYFGMRILAAVYAGYSVSLEGQNIHDSAESEQIPWVRDEEILSILTTS